MDCLQRHHPVLLREDGDTLRAFHHVGEVGGDDVGALGALELLARGDFERRFPRDVGDEEVHGQILAVHVVVHPCLDVVGHLVGVQEAEILLEKIETQYLSKGV